MMMMTGHSTMTRFQTIELGCPICGASFPAQVPEALAIAEKESDFCPRFLGVNPLPWLVHVCEGCGFAGVPGDFSPITDSRQAEKIRRLLQNGAADRPRTGIDRFRRAAVIATERNRPLATIGDLYLKAAWCARVDGIRDGSDGHCRQKALQYFEMAVRAREVSGAERAVLTYLIGELYRRAGNTAKANEWFERVDATTAEPWLIGWRDRQMGLLDPGAGKSQKKSDPD